MVQRLANVTFLHWRYPAAIVQARLPAGMTVDTLEGTAWVSVVPLLMNRIRPPKLPPVPWLSTFPETNLRTYVRGPDGGSGVFFLSLDAARLPAVLAGRAGFGLRYAWSAMSLRRTGDELRYRGRRRWPGPAGAGCDARVRFGEPVPDERLTDLDLFLTARYRLYSRFGGRLVVGAMAHPPWRLRRARLIDLRQDLIQAAGLPGPDHDPLVHAADGVTARIGMWRPV